MLLAIYGPHAVGKTYFLRHNMDDIATAINSKSKGKDFPEPIIVLADNNEEYHYNRKHDCWVLKHNKPRWKGKKEDKVPYICDMIGDRDHLWIVESARYFGGLQQYFIECFQKHNGGLNMYLPLTSWKVFHNFLQDRCDKRGKNFRADYWTIEKLNYESNGRYLNAIQNHYEPAGVKCFHTYIDYERTAWVDIKKVLLSIIRKDLDWWYESNTN